MWHRTMTPSSVLLVILQLWSLQGMVVSSPVCSLEGVLVESAYRLLRDLGGPFPVHCVKYNAKISFTDSVFPAVTSGHAQCHRVLWVVFQTLEGAWNVSDEYNLPIGEGGLNWDEVKFDDFQNLQYQLLEQGSCLSAVGRRDTLSSYFDNVTDVLQQQDSAACGWMALRRDLLWVLQFALQSYRNCFTWRNTH